MNSKICLLDANVIIWCAEHGKIDALFNSRDIKIPQIIFNEVDFYIDLDTEERVEIDLKKYIEQGSLEIIDSPLDEATQNILEFYKKCPHLAEIHSGEAECIALVKNNSDYIICTGELEAIKTIGFLGLSSQAISLEDILGRVSGLDHNFTKARLNEFLKTGSALRVQYGYIF